MPIDFQELVDDLAGEHRDLEKVVVTLGPDDWERDSHAPGWEGPRPARAPGLRRRHRGARPARHRRLPEGAGRPGRAQVHGSGAQLSHDEVLQWWREASSGLIRDARPVDPRARLAWYGPDMSAASYITARLMETWSHGLDIVDVVPAERPDTDRIRHVAMIGVRTRGFSYVNRGLEPDDTPVFVDLTLPSGAHWTHGDRDAPARISGPRPTSAASSRSGGTRRHPPRRGGRGGAELDGGRAGLRGTAGPGAPAGAVPE